MNRAADASWSPIVVKVGGSLYDLSDLGPRLLRWLTTLDTRQVLLVPGGGRVADAVRDLDGAHRLGEEISHWLALRVMTLNAHFLAALLSGGFVEGWDQCPLLWERGILPILDAHAFAIADDDRPGALPHCWDATSDALAARIAEVGRARLVLLKSIDVPDGIDWNEAATRGVVDRFFTRALGGRPAWAVNLRRWRG